MCLQVKDEENLKCLQLEATPRFAPSNFKLYFFDAAFYLPRVGGKGLTLKVAIFPACLHLDYPSPVV